MYASSFYNNKLQLELSLKVINTPTSNFLRHFEK
jgi:hypothetical protein